MRASLLLGHCEVGESDLAIGLALKGFPHSAQSRHSPHGLLSADPYSNTNGSPSANSALTMITETKPIERKGCQEPSPYSL